MCRLFIYNYLIDRFEINKIFDCPLLNDLTSVTNGDIKPSHQDILEDARLELSYKWGEWNEEELKMNFISVVFLVSQVKESKRIGLYYERKFFGDVNGIAISLVVDCMLASLSGQPKSPYFFYRRGRPCGLNNLSVTATTPKAKCLRL
jgi:hypothetical protein